MNQSEKTAVIWGIIGATLGGTLWIIIMGISMKSVPAILLPIIWGVVCVIGALKLYDINPTRKFAVMGAGILWLIILNFVFINLIYDKIPSVLGGISTGKEQISLAKINVFLGLISILGFFFLVKDIVKKQTN